MRAQLHRRQNSARALAPRPGSPSAMLSFNSFVPASDEERRRQAEAFGKQVGAEVRVDTISSSQLPAKLAAETQSSAGHDIVRTSSAESTTRSAPTWPRSPTRSRSRMT